MKNKIVWFFIKGRFKRNFVKDFETSSEEVKEAVYNLLTEKQRRALPTLTHLK